MPEDLVVVLDRLRSSSRETSVVEFKSNLNDPEQIGQYVSALANTAALEQRNRAWLVWGVEDGTHEVTGTSFDPWSAKVGNQSLSMWLRQATSADATFHRVDHPNGCVVMLEIHPARGCRWHSMASAGFVSIATRQSWIHSARAVCGRF